MKYHNIISYCACAKSKPPVDLVNVGKFRDDGPIWLRFEVLGLNRLLLNTLKFYTIGKVSNVSHKGKHHVKKLYSIVSK